MSARAPLAFVGLNLALAASANAQTPTPHPTVEPVVTTLTIFAGTPEKLWRTKDWGSTWEPVEGVTKAKQEPLSDVRALYPTGSRVYAGGKGGLAISDDFGVTWTRVAERETVLAVLASRYPQADPTLFLGTTRGLLKTLDGGNTLLPTAIQGTPVLRIEWPGPALVVASGRGVFVSADAGETAPAPGKGLPAGAEVRALAVSYYFQIDPVMFAGFRGAGVYRSSDAGESWHFAGLQGREVNDLAWLGPVLYAATDAGVLRSEDLGKSWAAFGQGLSGRVNRLLFPLLPDSGAVVFAATDQGVFRSEDAGLNWRFSGLKGENVISIATFPSPERLPPRRPRR
jgi:photosystem II stability/assembly factor-like uncharacterized protein